MLERRVLERLKWLKARAARSRRARIASQIIIVSLFCGIAFAAVRHALANADRAIPTERGQQP